MVFNGNIPKGRIIPVYLTDNGDLYPISVCDRDNLEAIGEIVAKFLGDEVLVDFRTQINNPLHKFSLVEGRKK